MINVSQQINDVRRQVAAGADHADARAAAARTTAAYTAQARSSSSSSSGK
jgi:hypothetical protein